MKNFIKNIFSSCLGALGAMILICGLFVIAAMGMASFFSDMSNFETGGSGKGEEILYLRLSDALPELTNNTEQFQFSFSDNVAVGVQDIVRLIDIAKTDDAIKGIVIVPNVSFGSYTTVSTIRDALKSFKESDKFVYAYSDYMSQKQYYLASVADSIYLNPNGSISFTGMGLIGMYFKNTLDMLGIKPEIYYVGDYKSATEPLRRTGMSDEDRLQKRQYLNALFDEVATDVAESRNLEVTKVRNIADSLLIRNSQDALDLNFIDGITYYSDFITRVKENLGMDIDKAFMPYSIESYYTTHKSDLTSGEGDEIAIVYAEGPIIAAKGSIGQISDDRYVDLLRKLQFNDDVKGVILRVNSPGGSALASDNIWHQINELKAAGKKVIVSMGTYAASGGYYISCNADYIYAEPTTLTGSIGVFGVHFNANNFFNEKLGITFDTVQTGLYTMSFTPFTGRGPTVDSIIQNSVEQVYQKFMTRVSDGRDIPISRVAQIAQGRVYTGKRALELGLVDEIGGLNDAINKMVAMLNLEKYDIDEYPQVKTPLEQFLNELSGKGIPDKISLSTLPPKYRLFVDQLYTLRNMQGIQARMPFVLIK